MTSEATARDHPRTGLTQVLSRPGRPGQVAEHPDVLLGCGVTASRYVRSRAELVRERAAPGSVVVRPRP